MYFKDKLGSYEIIVDKEHRIVYEKLLGLFTDSDSDRLLNEYISSIVPYIGEGKWVKLCDMREYIINTSIDHHDINNYVRKYVPYGFIGGAIITSSEKLIAYLFSSVADIDSVTFKYFACEAAAEQYLKSLNF